jgi:hypothetical protein
MRLLSQRQTRFSSAFFHLRDGDILTPYKETNEGFDNEPMPPNFRGALNTHIHELNGFNSI